MNIEELVDTVTIYGRVAFVLCIGEPFLELLTADPGYTTTLHAFAEAARWLSGGDVAGDILSDLLHNTNDEGILVYASDVRSEAAERAYHYWGIAFGYVAWQMYEKTGESPSALLSDFSEDDFFLIVDCAHEVPTYNEAYVQKVYDYSLSNYRIEEGKELGTPIDLESIKALIGSRSGGNL